MNCFINIIYRIHNKLLFKKKIYLIRCIFFFLNKVRTYTHINFVDSWVYQSIKRKIKRNKKNVHIIKPEIWLSEYSEIIN